MDKINSLKYLYIVYAISVQNKTDDILKREYECDLIKHNRSREKFTYERFLQLLDSWGLRRYNISTSEMSFHYKYKDAELCVVNNVCDINEAGCYPYAAIVRVPIGATYFETYIKEDDVEIYKYHHDIDKYRPFSLDDDKYLYVYMLYNLLERNCSDEKVEDFIKGVSKDGETTN